MKIKRQKKAQRFMSLYKNNFGFREPFQVLLDGTFCQVALTHKVNIQDQLPRYLSGQCKILTTACIIEEAKRLGKQFHGAYMVASQYPVHDCGHEKPVSANKCLASFVIDSKNKDHYLVATQDHHLRSRISKSVVCPLIKLANNALVIEKPPPQVISKVTRTHHYLANKLKDDEKAELTKLKKEEDLIEAADSKPKKKRRGPKEPNPLSCKKKKSKSTNKHSKNSTSTDVPSETNQQKRRRRRKTHIAPHVKKLLTEANERRSDSSELKKRIDDSSKIA